MGRTKEERYRIAELAIPMGADLAFILQLLTARLIPGTTGHDVDKLAADLIQDMGYKSSCLGHGGFPASICISPNNIVVHGIPNNRKFKAGDIVKLDLAINKDGIHVDAAVTVPVGGFESVDPTTLKVMECSYRAMMAGGAAAVTGSRVSDVTAAIQAVVEQYGFRAYKDFGGHGIGEKMHEDPFISNVVGPYGKEILKENQLVAIEPMINADNTTYVIDPDKWTIRGEGMAAQFEHTIRVGEVPKALTAWAPDFFRHTFGFPL